MKNRGEANYSDISDDDQSTDSSNFENDNENSGDEFVHENNYENMEDSDDDDIPPIRIIKKKQKKPKMPKKKTAIQNAKEKFSELFEIFLTDIENANDEKKLLIEFGNYIKEKLIAEKPAIFKSLAIVPDPPKKSKRKKKKLSFSKFFIYYNNRNEIYTFSKLQEVYDRPNHSSHLQLRHHPKRKREKNEKGMKLLTSC